MGARRVELLRERAAIQRQLARIDEAIADDEANTVPADGAALVATELEAARARKAVAKLRERIRR